jgi:very-short-patch-repair endonuclease
MRQGSKTFYARDLRKTGTKAEAELWRQLRNRALEDHKFVRQFPIGPYIVDFACRDKKLVVEIDGATHSTEQELASDRLGTAYLNDKGYRVLRFQNIEIHGGMDQVLVLILEALEA